MTDSVNRLMRRLRAMALAPLALFGLFAAPLAQADIRTIADGVQLHYNALVSTDIPAPVMKSYNLKRSKSLGLLNISLVETDEDPMGGPPLRKGIEASSMECSATTLNNQQRELEMSVVRSGESVYHLAQFPIAKEDKIRFSCQIEIPEGVGGDELDEDDRAIELDFSKTFHP